VAAIEFHDTAHWRYRKKKKTLGGEEEVLQGGALGPGIASTLGLFLLLVGRPGQRFARAEDEDPTAAGVASLGISHGRLFVGEKS
jgi:hypothetical protein